MGRHAEDGERDANVGDHVAGVGHCFCFGDRYFGGLDGRAETLWGSSRGFRQGECASRACSNREVREYGGSECGEAVLFFNPVQSVSQG